MKSLLLFPVIILVLTSAAIISPLVLLNTSDIVNTVVNRPVVGAPDPRFSIEASFNGPKLPPISCLMNSVEILVVLGLRDFSGSMEEVAWKLDEYPEVGMVISPSTESGRIELRFVIWGLSQGAAQMMNLIRFQAVTFTLLCMCSLQLFFPDPDVFRSCGTYLGSGACFPLSIQSLIFSFGPNPERSLRMLTERNLRRGGRGGWQH